MTLMTLQVTEESSVAGSAAHNVAELGMLCRRMERELNAANDRIKRLEDAGDALASWTIPNGNSHVDWRKAKEAL